MLLKEHGTLHHLDISNQLFALYDMAHQNKYTAGRPYSR